MSDTTEILKKLQAIILWMNDVVKNKANMEDFPLNNGDLSQSFVSVYNEITGRREKAKYESLGDKYDKTGGLISGSIQISENEQEHVVGFTNTSDNADSVSKLNINSYLDGDDTTPNEPTNLEIIIQEEGEERKLATRDWVDENIPKFPKPFFKSLTPFFMLPNSSAKLILKGAFFRENTTVLIEGQIVDNVTFISDSELEVDVTSGTVEGKFDLTIDNERILVVNDAFEVNLGTIYIPQSSDWTNLVGSPDVSENGALKFSTLSAEASAEWGTVDIDVTKDFTVEWIYDYNPLAGTNNQDFFGAWMQFNRISDGTKVLEIGCYGYTYIPKIIHGIYTYSYQSDGTRLTNSNIGGDSFLETDKFKFKKIDNQYFYYRNNYLVHTFNAADIALVDSNLRLKVRASEEDVTNIRYIEHPTT